MVSFPSCFKSAAKLRLVVRNLYRQIADKTTKNKERYLLGVFYQFCLSITPYSIDLFRSLFVFIRHIVSSLIGRIARYTPFSTYTLLSTKNQKSSRHN